jgi:hypothetical protein
MFSFSVFPHKLIDRFLKITVQAVFLPNPFSIKFFVFGFSHFPGHFV